MSFPAELLKKHGLQKAQEMARGAAIDFVEKNLTKAKSIYKSGPLAQDNLQNSSSFFGAAMHPVMDNWSPTHRAFQEYDGSNMYPGVVSPLLPWTIFIGDMLSHSAGEFREPTDDETNHMIDEMRLRFYEVYGEDAYNQAVSEAEREKTAQRLGVMSLEEMLFRIPRQEPR